MLLTNEEIDSRLYSEDNLMVRLKKLNSSSDDNHKLTTIVSIPSQIKSDDIIPDLDDKLAFQNSKSRAAIVMSRCLANLESKIDDPDITVSKLAAVSKDMSTVIKNLEPEQKQILDNRVQFVVHCPEIKTESDFEVVNASE